MPVNIFKALADRYVPAGYTRFIIRSAGDATMPSSKMDLCFFKDNGRGRRNKVLVAGYAILSAEVVPQST